MVSSWAREIDADAHAHQGYSINTPLLREDALIKVETFTETPKPRNGLIQIMTNSSGDDH